MYNFICHGKPVPILCSVVPIHSFIYPVKFYLFSCKDIWYAFLRSPSFSTLELYFRLCHWSIEMPWFKKTIDNCLQNLIVAGHRKTCTAQLWIGEGIDRQTCRTDIQMMCSEKLSYNAPIRYTKQVLCKYEESGICITKPRWTNRTWNDVGSRKFCGSSRVSSHHEMSEIVNWVGRSRSLRPNEDDRPRRGDAK